MADGALLKVLKGYGMTRCTILVAHCNSSLNGGVRCVMAEITPLVVLVHNVVQVTPGTIIWGHHMIEIMGNLAS